MSKETLLPDFITTGRFSFISNLDQSITLNVSSFPMKISAFFYQHFLNLFLIFRMPRIFLFATYFTVFSEKRVVFGSKQKTIVNIETER